MRTVSVAISLSVLTGSSRVQQIKEASDGLYQLLSDLDFADDISLLAHSHKHLQARTKDLVSHAWTQAKHEETQAQENEPSLICTNHPA